MSNIDPVLVKDVLHLPQAERKTDVVHDRKLDDFRAGFEIFERGTLTHATRNRRSGSDRQVPLTGPFLIVFDLDLEGGWSLDGVANTFGEKDWDFVGSNGQFSNSLTVADMKHYDGWAFRDYKSKENGINCKKLRYANNFRGQPLKRVSSCFGGMGIYRSEAILSSKYCGGDCEHVTLHSGMTSQGYDRLFMNPSQLALYTRIL